MPTEDGTVHAYEPDGSELPGWPVHTQTQFAANGHPALPALRALSSAGGSPESRRAGR